MKFERPTWHVLTSLFDGQELGHAGFSRVAKLSAYPMTLGKLLDMENAGQTHVMVHEENISRHTVEQYPTVMRSVKIMSIEEARQLIE